jgi:CRP/FNR family cyclic AMP-dependent transcriptional regulator
MMTSALLAGVPFFSGLAEDDLEQIAEHATPESFRRGALIISDGDPADALYVVINGRVKVFLGSDDGKEVVLTILGPGESFGEIALLDEEPRSASVAAMEKTTVLVIRRDRFLELLRENSDLSWAMIRSLSHLVRRLTGSVQSLALNDVYRRIVEILEQRGVFEGEVRVINERLTHQLLADMVGASREMVSRIMSDLVKGGYLTVSRDQIRINRRLPSGW